MISLGKSVLHTCIVLISTVLITNGTEVNNTIYNFNSAIIKFDPCVSILDIYNRFRYNDSELLTLVTKVATKFTKIYIQISEIDMMENLQTSISRSPLVIAKYNRQHHRNNNFPKLEVWLTYSAINPEAPYNDEFHLSQPLHLAKRLQALADEANAIYSGTITTLSFPVEVLTDVFETNNNFTYSPPVGYKLGILMDSTACKFLPEYVIKAVKLLNSQVVILRTRYILEDISQGNTVQRHDTTLKQCQVYLKNTSTTCFLVSIPDTYNYDTVKMAYMLSTWHQLYMWSLDKKVTLIFSEAFDTSCEQSIQRRTSGWWRLVENSTYESTNQFVFQEKAIIANGFDTLENPENYTWLRDTKQHNSKYLGIIFSAYAVSNLLTEYPDDAMNILMRYLATQYSIVVILLQDDGPLGSRFLLYEIQNVNKLRRDINSETEVIVMIMPHIQLAKYLRSAGAKSVKKVTENIGIDTYLVSKYILPYTGNETLEIANYTKNVLLAGLDKNKVKVAYSFNISMCLSSQRFYKEDIDSINSVLDDTESIWIYFEENDDTVKLGARRMFQQRAVLLEQCKKLLLNHLSNRNIKLELIFVMLHYSTQVKFYTNPWSLQNFVRYFDLLTEWANNTETNLIISNAIDGARKLETRDAPVTEIGWWRFQQDSDLDLSSDKGKRRWIDKREDALLASLLNFPGNNSESLLQTEHIVLIVLLPLLFSVALIVMALYLMRRYYREALLTKSEINEFFLGSPSLAVGDDEDECRRAHKVAYDKRRYEIDEKNFTINEGALGAGEFGQVCQGKIVTEKGPVNVAIKTVNPEKIHKTTLNGMLSEIKLLSYIGKHINIIELIGANTAELKHGKIFIFLELCHLGSLENYLRKLRPRDSCEELKEIVLANQAQGESSQPADMLQRYLNLTTIKKASLDSALSEDLYRWSKEICSGMAYLASKHVVHADLATRNVLLNLRKEAKICDFGLSRRMYNYTNYVKHQQEPLPWKWMSPESMKLMQFSEKSDVWAYGITLWEIYSLGESPYPGLSWDINFASLLESGFRMNEPTYNEKNMYSIMKECWNGNPAKRPSFEALLEQFN